MSSGISRDDWLRALSDAGYSDVSDEHAVTVHEFAAMMGGLPRRTAEDRLYALVKAGRAERTFKQGVTPSGRRIQYRAFKLLPAPKSE